MYPHTLYEQYSDIYHVIFYGWGGLLKEVHMSRRSGLMKFQIIVSLRRSTSK